MCSNLAPIRTILPLSGKHTSTVIFFHGSGSSADDVAEFVTYMTRGRFSFPHTKVVIPTAPLQPYSLLDGERSNVWFDRTSLTPSSPENTTSVDRIRKDVESLVETEHSLGITNENIIIGGISMGGALAFHAATRWIENVKGMFAMSSYLNDNSEVFKRLKELKSVPNDTVKIPELLQLHCENDPMIMLDAAKATFQRLKSLGVMGTFLTEDSDEHMPNTRQLLTVQSWILKKLS